VYNSNKYVLQYKFIYKILKYGFLAFFMFSGAWSLYGEKVRKILFTFFLFVLLISLIIFLPFLYLGILLIFFVRSLPFFFYVNFLLYENVEGEYNTSEYDSVSECYSENPPKYSKRGKKGTSRPKGLKYTKAYKESMTLSDFLKEALIGLLLGDAHAQRSKPNHNVRLVFDQSEAEHSEYLKYLFTLFEPYVGTPPKTTDRTPDKRTGKVYNSLYFKTLAFPCFNFLVDLFYPKGVKVIPPTIGELLTPIGLAFWIIDDVPGGISHGNLFLHTDSYTIEEVQKLITVLRTKFNLDCWETLRRPGQYAIYIPKRELHKVRKLVSQFMHPSIIYKISGD